VRNICFTFVLTAALLAIPHNLPAQKPLRIAIIGLVHGHVGGFLNGSAIVPAGGALHRPDVEIVGISDPSRSLFDQYAKKDNLAPSLYFKDADVMLKQVRPDAAFVFTSTYDHTQAVLMCARNGINVMMEKPFAVTYHDALVMQHAAQQAHIHVLVDYETSWYASNTAAFQLVRQNALGPIRKVVVRDGHQGPKLIRVSPEFFNWLTDPKLNGAGALYDFGCYGADLMTWLMKGEAPATVTAVTQHFQPQYYPNVDDEANVILTYPGAVAILEGSWNWPFNIKNMDVYGATGTVKTLEAQRVDVRRKGEAEGHTSTANRLSAPYDDPIHYLAAVMSGTVQENGSVSSLETNVIVSEILDAARESARTGKTVKLPLPD
jgi:glucose-fructose oxidoreductase